MVTIDDQAALRREDQAVAVPGLLDLGRHDAALAREGEARAVPEMLHLLEGQGGRRDGAALRLDPIVALVDEGAATGGDAEVLDLLIAVVGGGAACQRAARRQ